MKKTILLILVYASLLSSLVLGVCSTPGGARWGANVYYAPYLDCEPKLSIEEYQTILNVKAKLISSQARVIVLPYDCNPSVSTNFLSNSYAFYINPLDMKVTNTGIHEFSVYKGQQIILANEVESEWGTSAEEETPWWDSPPVYFSGNKGVVCDATISLIDNGNVIKEIPVTETANVEYIADKPGVHYIETKINIKSCNANFDLSSSFCPGWELIKKRNEFCRPTALRVKTSEYIDFENISGINQSDIQQDYNVFFCWPGNFLDSEKTKFNYSYPDGHIVVRVLNITGLSLSLPSNIELRNDAYIINVVEPTPEFNIERINAIILPSGEKPPLHLINLWEKI